MRLPLVVVGESLVDIVVTPRGETSEAVGGSPLNVAVGLARLGVSTFLITQIGTDAHGRTVAEHLRSSGVDLKVSSVVADKVTSTATAQLDANRSASYDFDLTWDLPHHALPAATGLHVGSLGAFLRPGRDSVLDLARQASEQEMFVSYDPNMRPAFVEDRPAAWGDVAELASLSRLVKVSDEDLRLLRPDEPIADLARELLDAEQTELVIITQGGDASLGFSQGFDVEVATPPVDVLDAVGAGDSFMAATLAILADWGLVTPGTGHLAALDEDRVRTILRGAMAAAAVTCSRRGANPPIRRELPPTWPAF